MKVALEIPADYGLCVEVAKWEIDRHRFEVRPRLTRVSGRWECKANGYRRGWGYTPKHAFYWWVQLNNPRLR